MKKLIYLLTIILIASCADKTPGLRIELVKQAHLSNLPSASGLEYADNTIYMIGDDMRWLVQLDDNWQVANRFPLSAIDTLVNNRTPWNIKADFESMADFTYDGQHYLLVLSSGSKFLTRDTAFLVQMDSNMTFIKKNIRKLFDEIKLTAGIPDSNEINIEGVAISNENAYLLHRGNVFENFILEVKLNALMNYLVSDDGGLPEIQVYYFNLPEHDGIPSGFSGACMLPDNSAILYTASLEDTKSELYDGEILGSFIGYIPIKKLNEGASVTTLLTDKNNKALNKKLESIVVKSIKGNKLVVLSVSDNDDGSSDIFELHVYLNNLD